MAWRPMNDEERAVCRAMVRWLEIRKKWRPDFPDLPSEADISKSALFERLRSGMEPLEFPPPIGLSCPWYAVVEDAGPHVVGSARINGEAWGPDFRSKPQRVMGPVGQVCKEAVSEVSIFQHRYDIVLQTADRDYVVKDGQYDTPYRFRLWWDPEYAIPAVKPEYSVKGAWLLRNMAFEEGGLHGPDDAPPAETAAA